MRTLFSILNSGLHCLPLAPRWVWWMCVEPSTFSALWLAGHWQCEHQLSIRFYRV